MGKLEKETGIEVAQNLEALQTIAVDRVLRILRAQTRIKDRVSLVLSGGSTPRHLYEGLVKSTPGEAIPWERIHLFWGDERCVPPDDIESNYRMARDSLIDRVPIPPKNIHRIPVEESDPDRAAEIYEKTLRRYFGDPEPEWPRFDLVLLGVGSDGHTASLFPGSPVLEEKKRWVVATYVEALKVHRLTLTLPVFNHAARVIFLVAGKEKAPVMKEALSPGHPRERLPYRLIRPHDGELVYLLDQDAAGQKNTPHTG